MADVSVRFAIPAEPLRPYLTAIYEMTVSGEGRVADMLHPEWANIRFTLDTPWAFGTAPDALEVLSGHGIMHGPTSRPTFISGGAGRAFGIGVLPMGWNRFWQADASRFADRWPPLSTLMGDGAEQLSRQLLAARDFEARAAVANAFFAALLAATPRTGFDDQVAAVHALIADPEIATVDQITERLNISGARLVRLAKRGFGFTPKQLLRRQRFLRMLGVMHERPYEDWRQFIDPQYVDQSHMIRDFQHFLGMSPGQYFAQDRPILRAAAAARAALFGQPLQGLHGAKLAG